MSNDIHLVELTAFIQGDSTTSNTIGLGQQTFVLTNDIGFRLNMDVTADAGSGNDMTGSVTSYTKSTKTLIINITSINGSGTFASWVISGTVILRFATNIGFSIEPLEVPPNSVYEPRVVDPGNFEINLFRRGSTIGKSQVGFGTVVLNNSDGFLDPLIDYGMDGRQIIIRLGTDDSDYPSGFTTLFTGTINQPEFNTSAVNIRIRDRQGEVANEPFQNTKYLGDNVLPDGVEGVPDDIKGKPKPILYGVALNFEPPLVNTSKLVYQISDEEIASIENVYDERVIMVVASQFGSLAALLAAGPPSTGKFDFYLGSSSDGAYFRLKNPVGLVTCDATQGATAADRTTAQIANQVLQRIDATGFISSSISDLDTENNSIIGIWINTNETIIGDVLDEILETVGGFWVLNNDGDFIIGRLIEPSGSPLKTFIDQELIGSSKFITVANNDPGNGIPTFRINLNYKRNYRITSASEIAGSVSIIDRNFIFQKFRGITSTDNNVITLHLLAREFNIDTLYSLEADAQTESDRVLTLYKTRRDTVMITLCTDIVKDLNLNDVVSINIERFTWSGGKIFVIIGIINNYRKGSTTLILWG